MKKYCFLYFGVIALLLCSCVGKTKESQIDWETLVNQTLKEELTGGDEKQFLKYSIRHHVKKKKLFCIFRK